jgi:hypothetical protein
MTDLNVFPLFQEIAKNFEVFDEKKPFFKFNLRQAGRKQISVSYGDKRSLFSTGADFEENEKIHF